MKAEPFESFEAASIRLRNYSIGKQNLICPQCSADRKKKAARPLCVNVKPEGGNWRCFHCEWEGYISKSQIYFKSKSVSNNLSKRPPPSVIRPAINPPLILKTFDVETVKRTLQGYDRNNFALWLLSLAGTKEAAKWALEYFSVGTNRDGETLFWYEDHLNRYRTCKRMEYKRDGHRTDNQTYGLNKRNHLRTKDGYFIPIYGAFQLTLNPEIKTVHLVESQKTAVVCKIWKPEDIWLSTGGASTLNAGQVAEVAELLKGKKVIIEIDADEGGRKAYKGVSEILLSFGINAEIVDSFPNRNDHHDLADAIENYILRIPNNAQITPVDAPKPENNTNGQLKQENAPQTNLEAKNGGSVEYADMQALSKKWALSGVRFMGFSVEYLDAVLQYNLSFFDEGNQSVMELAGLNAGFIEYLFERTRYRPDQTDRPLIEALVAYANETR